MQLSPWGIKTDVGWERQENEKGQGWDAKVSLRMRFLVARVIFAKVLIVILKCHHFPSSFINSLFLPKIIISAEILANSLSQSNQS